MCVCVCIKIRGGGEKTKEELIRGDFFVFCFILFGDDKKDKVFFKYYITKFVFVCHIVLTHTD